MSLSPFGAGVPYGWPTCDLPCVKNTCPNSNWKKSTCFFLTLCAERNWPNFLEELVEQPKIRWLVMVSLSNSAWVTLIFSISGSSRNWFKFCIQTCLLLLFPPTSAWIFLDWNCICRFSLTTGMPRQPQLERSFSHRSSGAFAEISLVRRAGCCRFNTEYKKEEEEEEKHTKSKFEIWRPLADWI